jgi:hypothetical protein
MRATKLMHEKLVLEDGSIIEMVIWNVPTPIVGSKHEYKYRLYFGRDGLRIVCFDNERGKGDHRHVDGQEMPYEFQDVDRLVADFMAEVRLRLIR